MASSKFLLFIVLIVALLSLANATEMLKIEQQLNHNTQEPLDVGGKEEAIKSEENIPDENITQGEAYLRECANKFINS
eukprot:CAMPEP_0196994538 /NCGR_PEP_ID=MMETSP1380-20130617/824_1 /TAXON_ID=5936 /ORGANISM="Euplotes crassus, Strain CT5" /LENGTH=77 /DNA_ID=CAMNT_0042409939 /DNA_START=29 /DNA_END=262 /DNA_ORIENTATION=-